MISNNNNQINKISINKLNITNNIIKNSLTNIEQNKELKFIILAFIDFKIIKKKINSYFNKNNNIHEKYYLLNYDWFIKYIELNNIRSIYNNKLINNNNIENIINNVENLPKKNIVEKIISNIDSNLIKEIKKNNNYSNLKKEELFKLKTNNLKIKDNKILKYYYNFILLKEETIQLLTNEFPFNLNLFETILCEKK